MYRCSHTSSPLPGQISQSQFRSFILLESKVDSERKHCIFRLLRAWEGFRLPPLGIQLGEVCLGKPGWQLRHVGSVVWKQSHYSCVASGELRASSEGWTQRLLCTPALPGSSGAFSHIPEASLRVGDYLGWPHLGEGSTAATHYFHTALGRKELPQG